MRFRAWAVGVGVSISLAAVGVLPGCGGQQTDTRFGNIKAGEMPNGQSWVGVYYNPVYGNLDLIENGENIVGRWKRTDSSHWGELSGTAEGNLMHFTWTEHQYGAIGPNSDVKGTGIFVYKMGEAAPEIKGQYALENSDTVGKWDCVKQLNVKPDLNSINGDNPSDAPTGAGDWK